MTDFKQEPTSIDSPAFVSFLDSLQTYVNAYLKKTYPNSTPVNEFYVLNGRRYLKVAVKGSGVYCFIDKQNGAVLKPAGWNAPAKHARGSIYDEHNGLKYCGPYGVAYLR